MTYETLDAPVRGGLLHAGRWRPEGGSSSPTVLAVHGVTANHRSWDAVVAQVPELDVLAPDLRGRGRSNDLPGPAGLHQHGDDLAALLDHVGLDKVVVAGHSMGALAAVVFADDHPDRVERLVLVDGGLPLPMPDGFTVDDVMTATLGPATARLAMTFESREAYRDFWRVHPAFTGGIDSTMAAYFDYDLDEVPDGFASSVRIDLVRDDVASQLDPTVLPPALERLRVPATLLLAPRGLMDGDPLYPQDVARSLADRLDLLTLVEVDDCNHYTIVFDPRCAAEVASHLRIHTTDTEEIL
jgi:pimeloyl-ACP methyl ester carboxylesterase